MDPGDGKRKPGGAKARRPCRRRLTCPTAREIGQAMASAGLGDLPQACSLEQLLERCLDAFDPDGRLHGGEYAVDLTLTTHGWVVPSAELARRLLALYQEALRDGREERALRVCHFVRHWALQHPDSFLLEPALAEVAAELRRAALHEGREGHARLLDTSHVLLPPPAWPRRAPRPPARPGAAPSASSRCSSTAWTRRSWRSSSAAWSTAPSAASRARTGGATCSGGGAGQPRAGARRGAVQRGVPVGAAPGAQPPRPPARTGRGQAHPHHPEAAGAAELQHADGGGGGCATAPSRASATRRPCCPPRWPRP
ncbi:RAS guanyl-releasing protein 4 [Anser cygnoides]|uniref:RAS guanyl-releasing protein 4 n=1 Tax=Anser cygnoides TaxID=8845 RepID=UPI0034D32E5D